jgi:hypothetical protein
MADITKTTDNAWKGRVVNTKDNLYAYSYKRDHKLTDE